MTLFFFRPNSPPFDRPPDVGGAGLGGTGAAVGRSSKSGKAVSSTGAEPSIGRLQSILVVLCSENSTQPVVNTGSLYT